MNLSELTIADLKAIETYLSQQLPPMMSGEWERVIGPEGKKKEAEDQAVRDRIIPRLEEVRKELEWRINSIFNPVQPENI